MLGGSVAAEAPLGPKTGACRESQRKPSPGSWDYDGGRLRPRRIRILKSLDRPSLQPFQSPISRALCVGSCSGSSCAHVKSTSADLSPLLRACQPFDEPVSFTKDR